MYNSYLPVFPGINNTVIDGRNINEGYQRGWGLQYGDLKDNILNDNDYETSWNLIADRSIVEEARLMNLFLIIKFYLPNILKNNENVIIIEFGTYRGGSAIFMANLVKMLKLPVQVFGLDTFQGMPPTNKVYDAHSAGDFKDTSLEELNNYKNILNLDNLFFIKGLFSDTAEILLKGKNVAIAHIDCDIFDAVKYSYQITKPYMIDGGYIIFDDATTSSCIGATSAVEQFVIRQDKLNSEQIYPHFVFRSFKI
ncbi:MAG: TylF/MycF family methyltransferase [Deferribacteraceae bacterium]|jgi:predicted O-methyltransferase YrrM|nr:TylF/MycF family methyltransferase [Deferribacteraceae bacterium]